MLFKCDNLVNKIFDREIQRFSPGTTVHNARKFYEYFVPNFTIYNVESPDYSFLKFTDDGLYLISFSRCQHDLIVYRPKWPVFSYNGENCSAYDLNSKYKMFGNFFTQLYRLPLSTENEIICKDFFLYIDTNKFGLFATSSTQIIDIPTDGGAIQGYPCFEKIIFHLVRLEDGIVLDKKIFHNDFIHLTHSVGAILYEDLLAVLSTRYQLIHIFQISECGNLVNVQSIGEFCREDDELFLSSSFAISSSNHVGGNHGASNSRQDDREVNGSFIGGLKQRLLSFVFRGIWSAETNQDTRTGKIVGRGTEHRGLYYVDGIAQQGAVMLTQGLIEEQTWLWHRRLRHPSIGYLRLIYPKLVCCRFCLKLTFSQRSHYLRKKFFFYFQDYLDLNILKVQFLDRHHLLLKYGNSDGGVLRNLDNYSALFAVYNMDTTEFVALYETSSPELYYLFERFGDHFHVISTNSMYLKFISSHSNNVHLLDQLESMKHNSSNLSQFIKKTLASLPFSSQSRSPSPYLDKYLFYFDDKLLTSGSQAEVSVKFMLRRKPSSLRFKIKAGCEDGSVESSGSKHVSSFLFHPHLPLILSLQHSFFSHSSVLNIHFRNIHI